ncbi:Reverse transcriptase RNA-dependent DNA polymerase [Arabidopsis thaliana x Arabidopsis arenosa]|uniref:Reverse transcriptase RNA-dependent DNA polymerase n=1 Tax=Arabidopsis thaliana x Arabidopsis arenosa TaxID=1240361 RepID=A0A8T1YYZ3_9BRAS|nr:Reverse transcriptase RNA-dependent DNA polymerase [Arabidopsis thaliana x Arabidopsis arenosa]
MATDEDRTVVAKVVDSTTITPYSLFSGDNPGSMISSVQLTGENYAEWATEMLNALKAKRKLGFIDGSIKKPTAAGSEMESWTTVNSMVIGWLRTSIIPRVRSTVSFMSDAAELWESLKKRFSVGNKVRTHQIVCQLAACRQDGQSVIEYYGRLVVLWDELYSYRPLPVCTCGASDTFAKEREDEKVHHFVMGLDESRFGNVICAIVDAGPMPDLAQAYAKVIREEQRLAASKKKEQQQEAIGFVARREESSPVASDVSGFATRFSPSGGRGSGRAALVCSNCGRTGHEKEFCWQIVGYPEWWTDRNKSGGGRGSNRGRGTSSGPSGRGRGFATVAHATSPHASAFPTFTPDQWKAISQMAQEKSNGNSDKLSGKIVSGKITEEMILDTGASHHMTRNLSLLVNITPISACSVGFADGSKTLSECIGVFRISERITLRDVLYVPAINCTLLSVSNLLKQIQCVALFTDTLCVLQDRFSRTQIGAGIERDGVYYLTDVAAVRGNKVEVQCDSTLWHRRLGHPAYSVFSSLPMISKNKIASLSPCDVCFRAKQTREVFSESSNKAMDCFSLIHVDVWGPYRVSASCGAVYFLTIVDDFSRAVWTYLLLEKSEVRRVLQNFCAYAEKQFSKSVRMVRSDNGTEFMCLSQYFKDNGIVHQTSCVDTPQQNGRVERKHRHILNVARSLLFQANLPVTFWGEAILTAAYLINRTPSKVLNGKTPYELLFGVQPSYDQLKVFGSSCYTHRRSRDKDKFGERSRHCIFMGYPFGKKGWKVYDMETNEFLVSRDVVFQENVFPFNKNIEEQPLLHENVDEDWIIDLSPVIDVRGSESQDECVATITPEASDSSGTSGPTSAALSPELSSQTISDQETEQVEMGQGKRQKFPSVRLKDFVTHAARCNQDPHHASSASDPVSSFSVQGTTPYPLTSYISDDMFSSRHKAFLAAVLDGVEPTSYKQAILDPRWTNAMGTEVGALEDSGTWSVVDLPPGKEAINNKWVYKIKLNADGSVERYKARLVACGNRQVEGEDYNETFAHVVMMKTVRSLLKIVAAEKWESYSDYSLFTLSRAGVELRVLIYVDDLLICGNHPRIEIARSSEGIYLSQRKYALDIVKEAGLIDSKPASTPIEQNHKLISNESAFLPRPDEYRRLVGRLIYLLTTRPELCYSVHILSMFMQTPRVDHWDAALRVVRYLKGSPGRGVLLTSEPDLTLTAYCDSDFSSCSTSRRSLSGYVMFLGGSPISWKTKKQQVVSHSSAEAEYRSMRNALNEVRWLKQLLEDLGYPQTQPIQLFCDSKAAIHISSNPVFHERTKHIERDCHAVRDAVQDGTLTMVHVRTHDQLADLLTKALGRVPFEGLSSKLGICDLHAPT